MTSQNNISLYEKIQQDLIQQIQNGVYQTGDRLPSENELSTLYHVSRITSAKALTELSLGGYITRIQGKGSFVNPLGSHMNLKHNSRHLTSSKDPKDYYSNIPKKIGLLIPEHADYHSGNIMKGITRVLQFPDFFLNTVLNHSAAIEDYALEFLLANGYDGIILFPTDCEFYSDTILKMHLSKFPFVLIDRLFPGIHCNYVTTNNEYGSKIAIDHFIALGHSKIAFMSDTSYQEQITSTRYQGYLKTMSQYGLNSYSYEHFFGNATNSHDDFIHNIITGKITAVLTSNSHVATRLYTFCIEHNISIPNDLSVICFDNPNIQKEPFHDFFTYVEQNSYDMGKTAALILDKAFKEGDPTKYSQVVLEPKLIHHYSTKSLHCATKE